MSDEPLVELYSADDCHLCETAKEVLLKVRQQHPFRFVEIKVRQGTKEYEDFGERIPVVFVNKQFAFQHRVNERELVNILGKT